MYPSSSSSFAGRLDSPPTNGVSPAVEGGGGLRVHIILTPHCTTRCILFTAYAPLLCSAAVVSTAHSREISIHTYLPTYIHTYVPHRVFRTHPLRSRQVRATFVFCPASSHDNISWSWPSWSSSSSSHALRDTFCAPSHLPTLLCVLGWDGMGGEKTQGTWRRSRTEEQAGGRNSRTILLCVPAFCAVGIDIEIGGVVFGFIFIFYFYYFLVSCSGVVFSIFYFLFSILFFCFLFDLI